tara:strand:+ start:90 stop:587 length:498 start_codon:yes stop_codon:yes gene_type:complete
MSDIDYVVPGIVVSQTDTVVDLRELYKVVKDWFNHQKYDILEKEHLKRGPKDLFIKWENEKKVDDYVKFMFNIKLSVTDQKDVIVEVRGKDRKKQKADVKFYIESFLKKDYENRWSSTPMQQFMRGFFDRFIISGKMNNYEKELEKLTFMFRDELKAYLKLQKLK